ncbi:MAG: type II toxin-antitoxin system VapC family toxin [Silvibacterium sp.]|nr:type II toxin-antitoxin system VapC family toxin [Silvibacterium sp.]
MTVVDANVLIYAIDEDSLRHRPARAWLEAALSQKEMIGLAWIVALAFLRLTTKIGLSAKPLSIEQALDLLDEWLNHPNVSILHPGPRHCQILRTLLLHTGSAGNMTSDAHLAALAIEHGAQLCSFDNDFARFPGLRWIQPSS